jgi:hypothetical protein
MKQRFEKMKTWTMPVVAVCLFVFGSNRAWTSRATASQRIDALDQLSASLNRAVEEAQTQRPDPTESAKIESQREELRRRLAESAEPGMVQAELMASARNVGLNVRDLQPVPSNADRKDAATYPCYRVTVRGAYAQLCDYMQVCKKQRVPARPVSFRVTPVPDDKGRPTAELQAEIVLESFAPPVCKPSAEGTAS